MPFELSFRPLSHKQLTERADRAAEMIGNDEQRSVLGKADRKLTDKALATVVEQMQREFCSRLILACRLTQPKSSYRAIAFARSFCLQFRTYASCFFQNNILIFRSRFDGRPDRAIGN